MLTGMGSKTAEEPAKMFSDTGTRSQILFSAGDSSGLNFLTSVKPTFTHVIVKFFHLAGERTDKK